MGKKKDMMAEELRDRLVAMIDVWQGKDPSNEDILAKVSMYLASHCTLADVAYAIDRERPRQEGEGVLDGLHRAFRALHDKLAVECQRFRELTRSADATEEQLSSRVREVCKEKDAEVEVWKRRAQTASHEVTAEAMRWEIVAQATQGAAAMAAMVRGCLDAWDRRGGARLLICPACGGVREVKGNADGGQSRMELCVACARRHPGPWAE